MPITTLPDDTEFEGPKVRRPDLPAISNADKTYAIRAAMFQGLLDRVKAAFVAIGLDDGTTAGSLREAAVNLLAGKVLPSSLQTFPIDSGGTINDTASLLYAQGITQTIDVPLLASITQRRVLYLLLEGPGNFTIGLNGSNAINGVSSDFLIVDPPSAVMLVLIVLDPAGFHTVSALATTTDLQSSGLVATNGIANAAVTGAKIQQSGTLSVGSSLITTTGQITGAAFNGSITTVSATPTTADGSTDGYRVTQSVSTQSIPLSVANWPANATRRVWKENTSINPITVTPPSGGTVQGGAVDAVFTLPGSQRASSTTEPDMWWDITRIGATNTFRVVAGGGVRYDSNGNVSIVGITTAAELRTTGDGSNGSPCVRVGSVAGIGHYRDATLGLVSALGGVDRLSLRTNGRSDVTSGAASTVAVLRMVSTAGGVSVFITSATPEGSITADPGAKAFDATNGREYLKVSGTGNTGWREQSPSDAGKWTPTATAVTNLDAVTASGESTYVRFRTNGLDWVFFTARGTIDATAAGAVVFRLSLPVASNFAATNQAIGVVGCATLAAGANFVEADATNDALSVSINTSATTAQLYTVSGSYQVIP